MKTFSYSVIGLLLMLTLTAYSQERVLAEVEISESAGIDRENEFVEIDFQSSVTLVTFIVQIKGSHPPVPSQNPAISPRRSTRGLAA